MAAGAVVEPANPIMPRGLAAPFKLASTTVPPHRPAPALGADTQAVLEQAGYGSRQIESLKKAGAFGT